MSKEEPSWREEELESQFTSEMYDCQLSSCAHLVTLNLW